MEVPPARTEGRLFSSRLGPALLPRRSLSLGPVIRILRRQSSFWEVLPDVVLFGWLIPPQGSVFSSSFRFCITLTVAWSSFFSKVPSIPSFSEGRSQEFFPDFIASLCPHRRRPFPSDLAQSRRVTRTFLSLPLSRCYDRERLVFNLTFLSG